MQLFTVVGSAADASPIVQRLVDDEKPGWTSGASVRPASERDGNQGSDGLSGAQSRRPPARQSSRAASRRKLSASQTPPATRMIRNRIAASARRRPDSSGSRVSSIDHSAKPGGARGASGPRGIGRRENPVPPGRGTDGRVARPSGREEADRPESDRRPTSGAGASTCSSRTSSPCPCEDLLQLVVGEDLALVLGVLERVGADVVPTPCSPPRRAGSGCRRRWPRARGWAAAASAGAFGLSPDLGAATFLPLAESLPSSLASSLAAAAAFGRPWPSGRRLGLGFRLGLLGGLDRHRSPPVCNPSPRVEQWTCLGT